MAAQGERHKGHIRCTSNFAEFRGRKFASRFERDRANTLALMQRVGDISDLKLQERVPLSVAKIVYMPDFRYVDVKGVYEKPGTIVYEETKGHESDVFKLKFKLWRCYGPGVLRLLKKVRGKIQCVETLYPPSIATQER